MAIELDHVILAVNDRSRSVDFYTTILGLRQEADDGPFATLRVTPGFVMYVAQSPTSGGEHYAFAMSKHEFDDAFDRVRRAGIPYGDQFNSVGTMRGPADEAGSRGMGKALYFFDPDKHLIEIRHYES